MSYSPPPLRSDSEIGSDIDSEVKTLAEVDYTLSQQDFLSDQLLCNAEEIGMKPDKDVIVVLKSEMVNLKVAKKAYALKHVPPKETFEANAIFDTGTNVLVTGCLGICMTLKSLRNPLLCMA